MASIIRKRGALQRFIELVERALKSQLVRVLTLRKCFANHFKKIDKHEMTSRGRVLFGKLSDIGFRRSIRANFAQGEGYDWGDSIAADASAGQSTPRILYGQK